MFKNGKIFGREPVLVTAFLAATLQVVSSIFTHWSPEQQGLMNAAFVAVLGFGAAVAVKFDKALPAVVGVVQALIAVAVGFGAHISDVQVSMVTAMIAAGVALWTRDRVTAPVNAQGAKVTP